ncbi:response regulator transcription factor [Clostridium intestinale]|uniref:Stage 0 sporulation protein A homolog n=1 Tax=Clostridium intestinale TaxID=36845 RepID=A0A7D6ZGS5_9CLOT|nr:response regulator [Clostridium intestinale]QLY80001.1 response regulator [Clostridium intestinale]
MIKTIIVDDEYYAREGMKKTIPWNSLECEIYGEADNALKAIEVAKLYKPELIITDINMPGIDGISMSQEIKKYLPNSKFIIITGYDDFQYARRAIKMNALDFILKPIDYEELINAIKNAVEVIKEEKSNSIISREKMLLEIIRGQRKITEIYNFWDNRDEMKIALIENDYYDYYAKSFQSNVNYSVIDHLKSRLKDMFKEKSYVIEAHQHRIVVIFKAGDIDLENNILSLKYETENKYRTVISVALTQYDKVENIKGLYDKSKELIDERFNLNKRLIIKKKLQANKSFDRKIASQIIDDIVLSVNAKKKDKVILYVDKLSAYFKDVNLNKAAVINMVMQIIIAFKEEIENYRIDINIEEKSDIYNSKYLEDIIKFLKSYLMEVIEKLREKSSKLEDTSMEKALIYIQKNYNKNISLGIVAKEVYLNESYLSRSFKKYKGMSFTEYITKLRMKKAIELMNTGKSINEIANEVGYTDYRSFSLNFKKYTGYIPREYLKKSD